MNKTRIEWCDSTWNPVTGCLHGCPYCYAEKIAKRFGGYQLDYELDSFHPPRYEPLPGEADDNGLMVLDAPLRHWSGAHGVTNAPYPYRFRPTFHRYRLEEPARKTKGQTIFVCSMADLFGKWVPTRWIVDVLDACLAAPQHRYLFLTKNPQRYIELDKVALLPRQDNFWYGSTATTMDALIFKSDKHNTFVSIEPILEPFYYPYIPPALLDDWYIIGAETGSRAEKVVPERKWVENIVQLCEDNGKPLFMKDSMKGIWGDELITEFPWEAKR